jgi:toxin FitB
MIAADSSVLIPALVAGHEAHDVAFRAAQVVDASVGHALVETYAVLTRLPQPYTVSPAQANIALSSYIGTSLVLSGADLVAVLERVATERVIGGATYDALIALTAVHHEATLLTRDRRAAALYERLGAKVRWLEP